ncbi:MAG: helix-turn-helix transcriptional regulator [Candidatus Izemoplasmatales bacterium]|nr:helix-turn-helix transcriptional regulator [Candidatus Izemoplasmatales bacterium]
MNIESILVSKLIELRNEKGITQKQLAQVINYSDKVISKWERGESLPDINALDQIAKFYGVSIDYLVREDLESQHIESKVPRVSDEIDLKKVKGPSALLLWSILPFSVMYLISIFIGIEFFIVYNIVFGIVIIFYTVGISYVVWEATYKGREIKITNQPTKLIMFIDGVLVDEISSILTFGVNLRTVIEKHEIKAIISGVFNLRCKIIVNDIS